MSAATTYLFTVLKRKRYGSDRVYQLEVSQPRKPFRNRHKQSHEHFGATRTQGGAIWRDWRYDEVLRYFCSRTNIGFYPTPPDPNKHQWRA